MGQSLNEIAQKLRDTDKKVEKVGTTYRFREEQNREI